VSGTFLRSLSLAEFRGCVTPFDLPFQDGKKLTLVYGENGAGKTTICDALEFLARGEVGSLTARGLGSTTRYWRSLGKKATNASVELKTSRGDYRASLNKSEVTWTPANRKPRVEILRRAQILRLVATEAADRYREISHFIDVAGVEASEDSLKKALDTAKRDRDDQVKRLQGSKDTLQKLFDEVQGAGSDPVAWARSEAAKDFSTLDLDLMALESLERAAIVLESLSGAWQRCTTHCTNAREAEIKASADVQRVQTNLIAGANDLLTLLTAASQVLQSEGEVGTCPLCDSSERVLGLAERVALKLATLSELKKANGAHEIAVQAHRLAMDQVERVRAEYAKRRDAFRVAYAAHEFNELVPMPSEDIPDELERFDDWFESSRGAFVEWKNLSVSWSTRKVASDQIKLTLAAYDENADGPNAAEALISRMEAAFAIVREERQKFTNQTLSDIAEEVGRLYEAVHPGEGLDKIGLQLDPKKRASLDLRAEFLGEQGVPPQAYFSESHLDTLGLCVFLALAKKRDPLETVLVIDDVVGSVDEPHVERVIEMICEESSHFLHCLVTTHYRPWREKYRWGWLKNGQCQFVELGKWTSASGLTHSHSTSEVVRLERILSEENPDLQAACAKAGVVLEAVLDFLTQLYQCRVPRKPGNLLTLGDLFLSVGKKLRGGLRVEVLSRNHAGELIYQPHGIGPLVDALERIAQARNVLGAHFNRLSFELLDADAIDFSLKVLQLANLVVDHEAGWPRSDKSGSYWSTAGDTRRLYPLREPR